MMKPDPITSRLVNPGKLFKPPTGNDLIGRERLFSRLREGSKIPLTLISAPSGFGKSTLVSSWLDEQEAAYAWLSLDENENSLPLFLRSLIGSVRKKHPGFAGSLEDLLSTPNKIPTGQLLIHFNQALSNIPGDLIIVLDDFHRVREADIHLMLSQAFQHPMQHIHLFLITRHDPPWPLMDFRAKGWLVEIRARDLTFTREELRLFLEGRTRDSIDSGQLDHILKVTEGWPTGVRLISAGMIEPSTKAQIDYKGHAVNFFHELIEQSLLNEASFREFCLWMSAFDEFNEEFAAYIFSEFSRIEIDARAILNELITNNLFIIPLDARNFAYRFHHLIREYLYVRLKKMMDPVMIQSLHAHGGDWYRKNGFAEKALKQYLLAEDYGKALEIFSSLLKTYLAKTDWASLKANLELFPKELRNRHIGLQLAQAWLFTYDGEIMEMFRIAADLRDSFGGLPAPDPGLRAEWTVLEAYRQYNMVQDFPACLELCEYALENLPDDHAYALGYAWIFLAGSLQVIEGTSSAVDRIEKGLRESTDPLVNSHQLLVLGYLYWMDGNIPKLTKVARQLIGLGERIGNLEAHANGLYFLGISRYTTGNLKEAQNALEDFLELRYHTIAIIHFMGIAALCLCRYLQNEDILNDEAMEALETYVQQQNYPFYGMYLEAFRTEFIWRSGNVRRARERAGEIDTIPLTPLSNVYCPQFTQIKVLLSGNRTEDLNKASEKISAIQDLLEATNNSRFQIDIDLLKSQLYAKKGNQKLEEKYRKAALRSASAYQIVSPFLEMDTQGYMGWAAACRTDFPGLYEKLDSLRPFDESPEPVALSPREKQVLYLLGKHLSNKEIGNQLNISEKTVKRHTGSLFKKLGVNSRIEAAELVLEFNIS